MTILLLTKELHPSSRVRLIELFQKEFGERGHKLFWIMQARDRHMENAWISSGNNVIHIIPSRGLASWRDSLTNKIFAFRKIKCAREILDREKIDVIVANDGILEGIIALYEGKKRAIPVAFYLSSLFSSFAESNYRINPSMKNAVQYLFSILSKFAFDYIIRGSDLFHPISDWMGKDFIERGVIDDYFALPICTSENFIGTDIKDSGEEPTENSSIEMIYVGQISRMRHLDFTVFMMAMMEKMDPDVKGRLQLRLIGPILDRGEREYLLGLGDRLGIGDRIEFPGEVPRESIPSLVKNAVVGISPIPPTPGYIVSSPTKCIEYISLGIPTVANNEIHDQKEVLEASGGGYSPPYEPKKFAAAILKLIKDPEERNLMGTVGREWMERFRSYDYLATILESRYHELINGNIHENQ